MNFNYSKILAFIRKTSFGLFVFTVSTIVGGFILKLCENAPWYSHAWKTVDKAAFIADTIAKITILHWIAGALLGFTLGVWVNDILRSISLKQLPTPNNSSVKGFLDYQMDIEIGGREITKVLGSASTEAVSLGEFMASQTLKINRLTSDAQRGVSTAIVTQKAHDIASKMGARMDRYCKRITAHDAKFSAIADKIITAVDWLVANQPSYRSPKTISDLTGLGIACAGARDNLLVFSKTIGGLRGIEAGLNQSCDRTISLTDHFADTMNRIVTLCDRVTTPPIPSSVIAAS